MEQLPLPSPLFTLILLLFLTTLIFLRCQRPAGFPPGPPRLPLLGSLLHVPHVPGLLTNAAQWFIQRYGKLVGLYLGPYPAVVLYDYEDARDLFNQDVVSGRPDSFVYRFRMLGGKLGLIFNDGEEWKNQRRFILKTLKDFGFGKKGLEGVLVEEADKLAEFFRERQGEPILVQNLFNVAILNVLWVIVASHRYDLSDPQAQHLVRLITESIQVENLRILFALPWTRHIVPGWTGWNKQKQVVEETQVLMRKIVKQHVETYDEENMRDFVDVYLREISTSKDPSFNEEQLLVNAMDLFSAGSETTATTLAWAVNYMLLHPEVQTKVQEEVDQVLGDRAPSLADRGRLCFTEATIFEIQRLGSIAPQAVPHRTHGDVTIRGYKIPKDTFVFSMLYYIMRDPDHWEEPDKFKPERFLDHEGRLVRHERFLPFGVGKRHCIGESLARDELFLIFTRLIQLFTFSACPGMAQPSPDPVAGFILAPKPYYAVATPRN